MDSIIGVTAPWMRIALNFVWGTLLICWLCSTIQPLACWLGKGRTIFLVLNGLLTISLTKPWLA
jgi:hypothetical protein